MLYQASKGKTTHQTLPEKVKIENTSQLIIYEASKTFTRKLCQDNKGTKGQVYNSYKKLEIILNNVCHKLSKYKTILKNSTLWSNELIPEKQD